MALDLAAETAAANALPYAANPFSEGIQAEDYRLQYAIHGERVRWWKAIGTPSPDVSRDGIRYIEQNLSESVRVLFFNDGLEVDTPEFGKIRVGEARHSGLPDEIELGIGDRTLYPDRARITSETIAVTGVAKGDTDDLGHLFVESIDTILDSSGDELDALSYELYGRAIRWRGTPPTGEVTVRYLFCPQYEHKGESDRQAFLGSDGKRLPQIVPLHLVSAGDERES